MAKERNNTYVFTYGKQGAGKSTALACVTYFLKDFAPERLTFRINIRNTEGSIILIDDWIGRLQKGEFPPRTRVGEVTEVDIGIEDSENEFESIGITFFEISGETMQPLGILDGDDKLPGNVQNALEKADMCIIVVPYETDSYGFQTEIFFENLIKRDFNKPTILVVSKWDRATEASFDEHSEYRLRNYKALLSKFPQGNVLPFSVGDVEYPNTGNPIITAFDPSYAQELAKWVYEGLLTPRGNPIIRWIKEKIALLSQ